jgi:hypothetical protein
MTPPAQPQPQGVAKCAELRGQCRESIFTKMDELHGAQMKAIAGIKESLAYSKGRESASGSVFLKLLIAWGPFVLFLLILGMVTWFREKGWM